MLIFLWWISSAAQWIESDEPWFQLTNEVKDLNIAAKSNVNLEKFSEIKAYKLTENTIISANISNVMRDIKFEIFLETTNLELNVGKELKKCEKLLFKCW